MTFLARIGIYHQRRGDGGMYPHRLSDGPGGDPRGRGATEPQVCKEKDTMSIETTEGETSERGGG